jgi:hypothetical protein
MNIKQWTRVLIATLLAFGSVQAFADSGWNYAATPLRINPVTPWCGGSVPANH